MQVRKSLKTSAAAFGVAIASLYVNPDLQGDVVGLDFSPNSLGPDALGYHVLQSSASQVTVGTFVAANYGGIEIRAIGNTLGEISSWVLVNPGDVIDPLSFEGINNNNSIILLSGTGSQYVGFRDGGNVGWFTVDIGESIDSPFVFGNGTYGNSGETLTVVPEPVATGLVALAYGAIGLRRRRRELAGS